jgi:YidC/Oxa1 family membrane protein insertase
MSALLGVPTDAAYHIVLAFTSAFTPLLGGLAAVAGIVVLTIAVRLLVMPLTFRALRGQAAQARLAPQLQRLRQRYGRQPERLQRELAALYAREGTTMFAGVWPLLVQWPVFSVLYLLFRSARVAGGANLLLSRQLFGVPLGNYWLSGTSALSAHGLVFLAVFALLAAACWLVARLARRLAPVPGASGASAASAQGSAGRARLLTAVLPYITVAFAAFAPLAAGIYLVTSTAWSAAERWLFSRRAGLGEATGG